MRFPSTRDSGAHPARTIMRQFLDKLGPRRLMYIAVFVVLALGIGASLVLLPLIARGEIQERALALIQNRASILASQTAAPLSEGRMDDVAKVLKGEAKDQHLLFVAVVRPDRTIVAKELKPEYAARLEVELSRATGRSVRMSGSIGVAVEPIRLDADKPGAQVTGTSSVLGNVVYGRDASYLRIPALRLALPLFALQVVGALAFILILSFFSAQLIGRPLTEMSSVAFRLSEADLTAQAPKIKGDDVVALLADSLNRIAQSLLSTTSRIRGVSEALTRIIERISTAGDQVGEGAGAASVRVVETGASLSQMLTSLKGIGANVEVLAQSADESSSSILEMAATNTEVAENIQALAASVEETTASIEQMTYSIKEVAKNVEQLSATSEETSSSMNEMDVSINQVETNANETAKLSEQAMKDAEQGTEALSRTLAGIERIKGSSKEAANVIDSLGTKIGTIGNILNVIDEVAEQTNLLALNAAILAAQSGEHGKGFAVVADEIKDLAERTGASTKEIAELIRSVQDESTNAIAAMDRGVKSVEEGVRLGQEAEAALKKIQASSVKSTQMVRAIAHATIEQARGSKQVTMAISRIAETVQQIARATAELAHGSEQIMKSAEKMKVITKHVERSSQEQARGSKQITKSIESISEMVNHLNRAQKDQTQGSEVVMTAMEDIKRISDAQGLVAKDLEKSIESLRQESGVLKAEMDRFKV